jgi:ABC-type amino acid transport substrate-binding protein
MRTILRLSVCALLSLIVVPVTLADEPPRVLHVATRVVPPMVVDDQGRLTGFSIELWNGIAEKLKATTEYKVAPDVGALLQAVQSGKADLGVAAISITAERDRDFDFSQPILDAGLQILVRGGGAAGPENPLVEFLLLLTSPTIALWLGIALLLIIVPAHIVWLFERRHPEGIVSDRRYFPGIFQAMWWAAGTLATQAEQMPRHWFARVLAVLWMFVGVVFVAYYTAQLTCPRPPHGVENTGEVALVRDDALLVAALHQPHDVGRHDDEEKCNPEPHRDRGRGQEAQELQGGRCRRAAAHEDLQPRIEHGLGEVELAVALGRDGEAEMPRSALPERTYSSSAPTSGATLYSVATFSLSAMAFHRSILKPVRRP